MSFRPLDAETPIPVGSSSRMSRFSEKSTGTRRRLDTLTHWVSPLDALPLESGYYKLITTSGRMAAYFGRTAFVDVRDGVPVCEKRIIGWHALKESEIDGYSS